MLIRRRRGIISQIALLVFILGIVYILYSPVLNSADDVERDSGVEPNDEVVHARNIHKDDKHVDSQPPIAVNQKQQLEKDLTERLRANQAQGEFERGNNKKADKQDKFEDGDSKDRAVDVEAELPAMEAEEPERQIELPGNKDKPGEGGKPVLIDKDKLSPEERKEYDLGWKNNAYNQFASDKISLHRSVDDNRDEECKTMKYRPNSELPSTSVIIIFHNEGWSVLLRTVHSVIDRSPPELLHEVILVDDKSTMDHLQKPLEDYVSTVDKLKLVRAQRREGLIRARLLGASAATGDILLFLDSHCEAAPGWLEPLADRIADNWSNVLTPIIEVITDDTLEFKTSKAKDVQVGGFTWNLVFTWHVVPKEDLKNRSSVVSPIRSPTMAGGLFAISRKYFEYIGTYDGGMEIWGGENLELSFRVWMCGGILETIPCSHVGHIFRKRSPYSWKSANVKGNLVKRNNVRLAEVWLDEYKEYYYDKIGNDLGEYGDVSARKNLRANLKCKSFEWFLKTIYPSLFVPKDSVYKGDIRSAASAICVDASTEKRSLHKPVIGYPCHNTGGNQLWMMSKESEIRRDDICLDFSHGSAAPVTYECHGAKGNQEWTYTDKGHVIHRATNMCMTLGEHGKAISMAPCDNHNTRQTWKWKSNKH